MNAMKRERIAVVRGEQSRIERLYVEEQLEIKLASERLRHQMQLLGAEMFSLDCQYASIIAICTIISKGNLTAKRRSSSGANCNDASANVLGVIKLELVHFAG